MGREHLGREHLGREHLGTPTNQVEGALGDTHKPREDSTWGHPQTRGQWDRGQHLEHLGTPTNQEAVLPSLTPFATERFLLLRQIVVNCFNLKEINSVHLNP